MGGIMLKKYVITVCLLSMLFIAACDRKSVNDIYSMQSESSSYEQQTSDKENKVISKGYRTVLEKYPEKCEKVKILFEKIKN